MACPAHGSAQFTNVVKSNDTEHDVGRQPPPPRISHQRLRTAPLVCRSITDSSPETRGIATVGVADRTIVMRPVFVVHSNGVEFVPNAPQSFHDRLMPAATGGADRQAAAKS